MKRFRELLAILFPLRAYLAEEVAYLRQQLAQKQRRIDELQDALIAAKQPNPRIPALAVPKQVGQTTPRPQGWDAFRVANKEAHDHADADRTGSAVDSRRAEAAEPKATAGDEAGDAAAGA